MLGLVALSAAAMEADEAAAAGALRGFYINRGGDVERRYLT